jgi:hypothetical protein
VGRFDTRRLAPPVRIGLAAAADLNRQLGLDVSRFAAAAEYQTFAARRGDYAYMSPALRIGRNAGPNQPALGALPINRTRTKRGFPVRELPAQ